MDLTSQVLLDLIKASLWGTPLPNYDLRLDEPVDWGAVLEEAKIQAVASIVAPVIPNNVPEKISARWKSYSYKIVANYHKVLTEQDKLCNLMQENNIPLVILKGSAAAIYYPTPSHRNMGDIDFLVPQDKFKDTELLLSANGYILNPYDESKKKRHITFNKNGIHFELHHHFSHKELDIEHFLIDDFPNAKIHSIDGHYFPMFPSSTNGLVLLDHMRNHLKAGLGLRQVIDWMLFVNSELTDELWETSFSEIMSTLGTSKFAITMTQMCILHLGLEKEITWCNSTDSDLCTELIENIMKSGSFGRKMGKGLIFETTATEMKRMGTFKYLQYAGKRNWEACHKHKWLNHFAWIYQICHLAKKSLYSKRSLREISSDLERSNDRYKLLKKLGID